MSENEMISTTDVAKRLGYSSGGVRNMLDRGLFPGACQLFPGGPWRIPLRDVEDHLAQRRAVRRRKMRRGA